MIYPLLALAYMAAIYWLSSLPGDVDPELDSLAGIIAWTPPALQNLLHIPMFGLLAWLWHRTLSSWRMRDGPALATAFLLAAGFGVFDEWHQLQVPGRYASFTDITLNLAGVVLALWWVERTARLSSRAGRKHQPEH